MRCPKPEPTGDGKYRLTIRRRSPMPTVMCPALRLEGAEGHLLMCLVPRPGAVRSSVTPCASTIQKVTVR
ncbi:hypothetical protein GCM10009541_34750 [Micromonospora gifhornensis]|uniref:Uncharacterized protein n=1 Tax=Micromonospora gifhornensis TaxID=84594 RepID=A0ABQ4IMK7_9ACTN|nr:hypothetical protein Vgi01_58260 [Micromonospora gifhornensis]